MSSSFDIIYEEFFEELEAIRALVLTFSESTKPPKARIAAANSATLLVAATFEEFVREMAREYARTVVASAESFEKLPTKLASTAWRRTMDGLSKVRFDDTETGTSRENVFGAAQARFSVVYEFCKGDLTQDIYHDLIHNENNMRPGEINSLFKVSGLSNVCDKVSKKNPLLSHFGETDSGKVHGQLLAGMDDFFERRNIIAHALKSKNSSGPSQIQNDMDMLESFGKALCETLSGLAPKSLETEQAAGTLEYSTNSKSSANFNVKAIAGKVRSLIGVRRSKVGES
jgi:RiboL-PSP-HEPN